MEQTYQFRPGRDRNEFLFTIYNLQDGGFRLNVYDGQETNSLRVVTRDPKLLQALEEIRVNTDLAKQIARKEMAAQIWGGTSKMTNGRDRQPAKIVTLASIEEDALAVEQSIIRQRLGRGRMALVAHSVRCLFGR